MKKLHILVASSMVALITFITPVNAYAATYNNTQLEDNYEVVKNYTIVDGVSEIYFDPTKAMSSSLSNDIEMKAAAVAEERYLYTDYSVTSKKLISYDSKSKDNEVHLISVPRGYTLKLGESKTVTGSLSTNANITSGEKAAISKTFSLSASGSISKTYTKDETFTFPPQYEGIYSTANFYTAIGYDYYEMSMHSVDIYNLPVINHPIGKNEKDYTIYVYVPKVVMYTVGTNYGN